MSETPLVDENEGECSEWSYNTMVVSAGFARELELKLNAANQKIVDLQGKMLMMLNNQHGNYNFSVRC